MIFLDRRAEGKPTYSGKLNALWMVGNVSEEGKSQLALARHIKKSREQYKAVTDEFIVEHTNSVYLMQNSSGLHDLIVYVDGSIYAAELNARREFIKWRYLDEYGIELENFEIRISKGSYRNNYPFKEEEEEIPFVPRELSNEEMHEIDAIVAHTKDPELKESFRKLLIAEKQNSNKN